MDQKQIAEEIEVQDGVLNYGQVLFIKYGEYQAYCRNPISSSDWLVITQEIKDKRFLLDLSCYKENKTAKEKIYKAYLDIKNKAVSGLAKWLNPKLNWNTKQKNKKKKSVGNYE